MTTIPAPVGHLQVARFTGSQVEQLMPGPPLRCASLLKPLYVWVASGAARLTSAEIASVEVSDNDATTALLDTAGGLGIVLGRLHDRTGVRWSPAPTWGRVEVTAEEVARAYAALACDRSPRAAAVVAAMRRVRPAQTLGVAARWAALRGTDPAGCGVKCGWDLDPDGLLRTHAVVCDHHLDPGHGPDGAVVLTVTPLEEPAAARWRTLLENHGPEGVLAIHATAAGPRFADALAMATSPGVNRARS